MSDDLPPADDEDPIDAWVERALASAPPFSAEQRGHLRELLRPVRIRPRVAG